MKEYAALAANWLSFLPAVLLVCVAAATNALGSDAKTIYDIQHTTDPGGDSTLNGQIIDSVGGIVTHKFPGNRPKLTLYDPSYSDGWGGVQVKDWTTYGSYARKLFDNVNVGDWISLTNVEVEEYRGGTFLKYHEDHAPDFNIESTGNPLPAPIVVAPADITAPLEGPVGQWHVAGHVPVPEKYEAMWLEVRNVTVTGMDLGKAADNYVLSDALGDCWAADYMNTDVGTDYYHPLVEMDREFLSVTGVLEQYTKLSNGWDYYQLVTTGSDDLEVPEPATLALLPAGVVAVLARRRRRK